MNAPTCRVSGLRVELTRDGADVVDGIDFELRPGEVLTGPAVVVAVAPGIRRPCDATGRSKSSRRR